LIDGREFDSSRKRGDTPANFGVDRVIKGWTEVLQLMKPGSEYDVWIPPALAYGPQRRGEVIGKSLSKRKKKKKKKH